VIERPPRQLDHGRLVAPLIDPATLEFEVQVEGRVSYGGLGGPAILPQSLAKISQMRNAMSEEFRRAASETARERVRPAALAGEWIARRRLGLR